MFGYSALNAGRIWRSGCLKSICRHSMGSQWVGDSIGKTPPRRGATYLKDSLPNHLRTLELPHQRVSGTGGDADNDTVSFLPLACTGYLHNIGGGKPSPPMVPLIQHIGDLGCTEWEAPHHCQVRQGGREEAPTAGGGRDTGEYIEIHPGL